MVKKTKFNLKALKRSDQDARDLNYHIERFVSLEKELPISFIAPVYKVKSQGTYGSCSGFAWSNALTIARGVRIKQPEEPPAPKPTTAWFRCMCVDLATNFTIGNSEPYVLIDGTLEAIGKGGIVVAEIPSSIVDKGEVEVLIYIPGYLIKSFKIDFSADETQARRASMIRGQSIKPVPIDNYPTTPEPQPIPPEEIDPIPPEEIEDNVPPEQLPIQLDWLTVLINFIFGFFKKKEVGLGVLEIPDLSPKFIYSMAKIMDKNIKNVGTSPKRGAEVLCKYGCVRDERLPYTKPIPEDISDDIEIALLAKEFKCSTYHRLYSIDEMKSAFYNGVGITIALFEARTLPSLKKFDFPAFKDYSGQSGHIVAMVGWDEKGIIILNSWGDTWGEHGLGRIPYDSDWLVKSDPEFWGVIE